MPPRISTLACIKYLNEEGERMCIGFIVDMKLDRMSNRLEDVNKTKLDCLENRLKIRR